VTKHYKSALCGAAFAAVLAGAAGSVLAQTTQPAPAPAAASASPAASATPQATAPSGTPASPAPAAPGTASAFPPQPPPAEVPPEKRGFLNDFGSWWNKSVSDFNTKMKEQQTKIDDFNKQSATATQAAMKNAADAMRIPVSKVVEMHEVCATAGNGAPDCGPAVTNACRAKGFKDGEPVDIRTAEKCSASLWVSGQTPTRADCPNETMVLRAACRE
jgi:hypothetical protein